jgi:uncharacterized protein (TIGR03382 family)
VCGAGGAGATPLMLLGLALMKAVRVPEILTTFFRKF